MRDPVRHVGEFFGIYVVEILENTVFDDLAVKGGNPVDLMRGDDGKIRHPRLSVRKNGHPFDFIPISGEKLPHLSAETLIDFL